MTEYRDLGWAMGTLHLIATGEPDPVKVARDALATVGVVAPVQQHQHETIRKLERRVDTLIVCLLLLAPIMFTFGAYVAHRIGP